MVDGRKPLAVIDLDGTLVAGNTFHEYLRLGLRSLLRRGKLLRVGRLALLMALRAARVISHPRLKFGSLKLITPTPWLQQRFTAKINSMKSPDVERMIEQFKADGAEILLATAAPAIYVPWIWSGNFVATTGSTELRGTAKLHAVNSYIAAHNLTLHTVVSDHDDDLPLLNAAPHPIHL